MSNFKFPVENKCCCGNSPLRFSMQFTEHFLIIALIVPEIIILVHVPRRRRTIGKIIVFVEYRLGPKVFGHKTHTDGCEESISLVEQYPRSLRKKISKYICLKLRVLYIIFFFIKYNIL